MSKRIRLVLPSVACVLLFTAQGFLRAEEASNVFNPFSKTKTVSAERATSDVSDKPEAGLSLPALPKPSLPKFRLPKWSLTPKNNSNKPSTWDKVSSGTRGFFVKTKQVLMPWANNGKVARQDKSPPGTVYRSASRPQREDKEKSLLPSWLQSKPEEEKIESVNDFLSLPSPQYN